MTTDLPRLIVCPNCGGPLAAPVAGGTVACTYCGVSSIVGARPALRATGSLLPDPASPAEKRRLQDLRAAARTFATARDRYSLDLEPEGFTDIDGFDHSRDTAKRLERALTERLGPPGTRSEDDERTLWWIATRLINLYKTRNDSVRANAVAEAATEAIADPRLRHGFYLTLSSHARRQRDWAAAETWLAQCDPAPLELALDSDYRTGAGMYFLAREQWADAVVAVGEVSSTRPWSPQCAPLAFAIRAAAHERLGEGATAEEDLLEGMEYLVAQTLAANTEVARSNPDGARRVCRDNAVRWYANLIDDSVPLAGCRDAWTRLAGKGDLPEHAAAVKAFRDEHG